MLRKCRGLLAWSCLTWLVAVSGANAQQTLDLALVIAVDVSSSMSHDEQEFQRGFR
jgi:hypothetical protein